MKVDLKVWNRDEFGYLDTSKKMILKEIEELDVQDDNSNLEGNAKLKRMELISQLTLQEIVHLHTDYYIRM